MATPRKKPATSGKRPAEKKAAAPKKPAVDLHAHGARVISVFGAFQSRVLVEMPTGLAGELFSEPLAESARGGVVTAVERDLEAIRVRDPKLAESALAASALELAYQLEHPFNSATAKSMCARAMREALDRLLELLPPEQEKDGVDDLAAQRAKRLSAGGAAA